MATAVKGVGMTAAFYIRDGRRRWDDALTAVAGRRGYRPKIISKVEQIDSPGYGFIRPHTNPGILKRDRLLGREMHERLTMIQDLGQIEVYDNKRAQIRRWSHWMPETWVFRSYGGAMDFLETAPFPLISKADVGASSRNVRFLDGPADAEAHLRQIFTGGIPVNHCAAPLKSFSLQKDYVILQRFIPHEITYRVNAIGRQRAVFFRSCYADRPMAQTGNTTPAYGMDSTVADLLVFAEGIFEELGTKWCALDILRDGGGWKLLETSLAWPWPSPGDCNSAAFFGMNCESSKRRWIDMFDVMFDEIEAGAWGLTVTGLPHQCRFASSAEVTFTTESPC